MFIHFFVTIGAVWAIVTTIREAILFFQEINK